MSRLLFTIQDFVILKKLEQTIYQDKKVLSTISPTYNIGFH